MKYQYIRIKNSNVKNYYNTILLQNTLKNSNTNNFFIYVNKYNNASIVLHECNVAAHVSLK